MFEQQHKVLIVDDEPGLLFSLSAYLEDEGFEVRGTSTGEEALLLMEQESFDAVIIDVRLPGKDGDEIILDEMEKGSIAHFLIHTRSTEYQLPKELESYGLSDKDIFLKPLPDLDVICQALHERIKKARNTRKNAVD